MVITCIGVSWCAVLMLAWFMLFFFESWFVFCYSFKQRFEFSVGFFVFLCSSSIPFIILVILSFYFLLLHEG